MTNQEAFEKSYRHVMSQPKRCESLNARGMTSCSYAAPDGCSCGVGCLLPREIAERAEGKLGGHNWRAIDRWSRGEYYANDLVAEDARAEKTLECAKAVAPLAGVSVDLLSQLQSIHDQTLGRTTAEDRHFLNDCFERLAANLRLKMPELL